MKVVGLNDKIGGPVVGLNYRIRGRDSLRTAWFVRFTSPIIGSGSLWPIHLLNGSIWRAGPEMSLVGDWTRQEMSLIGDWNGPTSWSDPVFKTMILTEAFFFSWNAPHVISMFHQLSGDFLTTQNFPTHPTCH